MDKEEFIEEVFRQALITLAWSEIICIPEDIKVPDDIRELDGKPLDDVIDGDEIEDERNEFREQVRDFVENNWHDVKGLTASDVGHNFVLSKNNHGTGFWDRGWGELGDRLDKAAEVYGDSNLYFGDDMKVYVSA